MHRGKIFVHIHQRFANLPSTFISICHPLVEKPAQKSSRQTQSSNYFMNHLYIKYKILKTQRKFQLSEWDLKWSNVDEKDTKEFQATQIFKFFCKSFIYRILRLEGKIKLFEWDLKWRIWRLIFEDSFETICHGARLCRIAICNSLVWRT